MRYTALLTSNQNGGKLFAKENSIGPITFEICAEGALSIYGKLDTSSISHDGFNDLRNA